MLGLFGGGAAGPGAGSVAAGGALGSLSKQGLGVTDETDALDYVI